MPRTDAPAVVPAASASDDTTGGGSDCGTAAYDRGRGPMLLGHAILPKGCPFQLFFSHNRLLQL